MTVVRLIANVLGRLSATSRARLWAILAASVASVAFGQPSEWLREDARFLLDEGRAVEDRDGNVRGPDRICRGYRNALPANGRRSCA